MIVYLHATGLLDKIDCGSGILSVCGLDLTIEELVTKFHWLTIVPVCQALREGITSGRVRKEGGAWIIDNIKFRELRATVIFHANHLHLFLEGSSLRGREVLDIGAYIGETALYFLAHGAKRVVAVEPHPAAYREMVENIELNSAKDRVVPINAAVGGSRGLAKIPIDISLEDVISMSALEPRMISERYAEIPVVMLEDLMDRLEDPYMIKLNCEGCEWEILRKSLESLKKFHVILIQYHDGDYRDIVKRLGETHRCSLVSTWSRGRYGWLACKKL